MDVAVTCRVVALPLPTNETRATAEISFGRTELLLLFMPSGTNANAQAGR